MTRFISTTDIPLGRAAVKYSEPLANRISAGPNVLGYGTTSRPWLGAVSRQATWPPRGQSVRYGALCLLRKHGRLDHLHTFELERK